MAYTLHILIRGTRSIAEDRLMPCIHAFQSRDHLPTVQGVFRRGLQLEALKEFILSQGASKNVTLQEWEKLWSINKRIIDPVCPRSTEVS